MCNCTSGNLEIPGLVLAHHPGMTVERRMQFETKIAIKAVARADLNLVGLALRAERKVIDKILDGLKFDS
jgi:hypothetical protein